MLLASCASPLRCSRIDDDVACTLSAGARRRPVLHVVCRVLGGDVMRMRNDLGQEFGEPGCRVDVSVPRSRLAWVAVALGGLLVAIRVRRALRRSGAASRPR